MEQSGAQSKSMQNHSSAEKPPSQTQISIKLVIKIKNVNDERRDNQQYKSNSPQSSCTTCGQTNLKADQYLITKVKKCLKCGRIGHFLKYCKTKIENTYKFHQVSEWHFVSNKKNEQQN